MSKTERPPELIGETADSNLKSVETTTGRLIIFNQSDAKERISSAITMPIER